MKLSDLVAYRSLLRKYQPMDITGVLDQHLGPLVHAIDNSHIRFVDAESNIHRSHKAIRHSIQQFDQAIADLLDNIEESIAGMTPAYLARSYQLYDENMRRDTPELILSRRIHPTSEVQDYLNGRIKLFTDWRRAGMIIRPAQESWIADLVALDPLYIVDTHRDLLDPSISQFTPEYQRRVRPYVLDEAIDHPLLQDLPNNQIGFCLVYNFFNYKPFELVRQYLQEIFDKLQPGGRLFFTINDCDRAGGVDNSERSWMCFTPGSLVTAITETLGYQILQTYHIDAASTWYEVQKPGEFQTLRGGQNLARINWRGSTVDTVHQVAYTVRQQEKILKQARKLNIDTDLPLTEIQKLIGERKSQ